MDMTTAMDTATGGSNRRLTIGTTMGEQNKTDYTVYKIVDPITNCEKVMVMADAKTKFTVHSLAQMVGYYSAFNVSMPPPAMAILTSTNVTFHLHLVVHFMSMP